MALSLGHLLEAVLLVINALAVLQDYSPSLVAGQPPVPRFLAQSERWRGATRRSRRLVV
jgi:hypothetical protein